MAFRSNISSFQRPHRPNGYSLSVRPYPSLGGRTMIPRFSLVNSTNHCQSSQCCPIYGYFGAGCDASIDLIVIMLFTSLRCQKVGPYRARRRLTPGISCASYCPGACSSTPPTPSMQLIIYYCNFMVPASATIATLVGFSRASGTCIANVCAHCCPPFTAAFRGNLPNFMHRIPHY